MPYRAIAKLTGLMKKPAAIEDVGSKGLSEHDADVIPRPSDRDEIGASASAYAFENCDQFAWRILRQFDYLRL